MPRKTENTKKKQLRFLRTAKLVTPTQLSGKNGKMQQLPENRKLCTGMSRKTAQQLKKNKLSGRYNLESRQRRKSAE